VVNDAIWAVNDAVVPDESVTDDGTVTVRLLLDRLTAVLLWTGAVRVTEQLSVPAAL
jgi:hypothetical protein